MPLVSVPVDFLEGWVLQVMVQKTSGAAQKVTYFFLLAPA